MLELRPTATATVMALSTDSIDVNILFVFVLLWDLEGGGEPWAPMGCEKLNDPIPRS